MKVDVSSSSVFYGRKINLYQAKEMNVFAQRTFPYKSSWKMANLDTQALLKDSGYLQKGLSLKEFHKLQYKMSVLTDLAAKHADKLFECREKYYKLYKQPFEYFRSLVTNLHKYQSINCGEFARIEYMLARINDVDDSDISLANLSHKSPRELIEKRNKLHIEPKIDHVITKIKSDDGEIGIDPLLNETDFLENLARIYQCKYGRVFNIPIGDEVEFLSEGIGESKKIKMPRLSDEEVKELRKLYPNFIIY